MRVLSDGRKRWPAWPAYFFGALLSGIVGLAFVGAFVTVRALVEWLT